MSHSKARFVLTIAITLTAIFALNGCAAPAANEGESNVTKTKTETATLAEAAEVDATPYALVAPILPGQLETWRAFSTSVAGERKREYADARRAAGVTREAAWLQQTPAGDFAVIYHELEEPARYMPSVLASDRAIDREFLDLVAKVHGVDVRTAPPREPNPLVLSYDSGERAAPIGFAVPLQAGKLVRFQEIVEELKSSRAEQWAEFNREVGVTVEHVWIQNTPKGDFVVFYQEVKDPAAKMRLWFESESEFAGYMLDNIEDLYGVDLRESKAAPPEAVLALDF